MSPSPSSPADTTMRRIRPYAHLATVIALALPCLSLGSLGCWHERRDVVVEPRHETRHEVRVEKHEERREDRP